MRIEYCDLCHRHHEKFGCVDSKFSHDMQLLAASTRAKNKTPKSKPKNMNKNEIAKIAKQASEKWEPFTQNHDPSFIHALRDAYSNGYESALMNDTKYCERCSCMVDPLGFCDCNRPRTVEDVKHEVMDKVNKILFPIAVRVTRKEFLKLPLAVRRRAMREMAGEIAAESFQALMDQGDEE
jgi:hypothetical protein